MTTTYRPLPDNVTIKKSKIEGLGLFATKKIIRGTTLGVSHWKQEGEENNVIRTPLGGFVNHSEEPNCQILDIGTQFILESIRDIRRGEEITLKYNFYILEEE